MSGRVRALLGLAVTVTLVALLFRAVNVRQLWDALIATDPRPIVPAIALYLVSLWVRSLRWALLLPRERVTIGALFPALIVGLAVNNLLPARIGELARAYLLARWCGVAYGATVASVVVERGLDGATLATLLLAALVFTPWAPAYLSALGWTIAGAFVVALAVLGVMAWRADMVGRLAHRATAWLPGRAGAIAERLSVGFVDGLRPIRGWRLLGSLVLLSFVGWALELSLFYVLLLDARPGIWPPSAVAAGAAANFATLVPSSPGYVGTFDAALVKVVVDLLGISTERATAYALLVHATLFLPVVFLGLLILWRADISVRQVTQRAARRGATLGHGARRDAVLEMARTGAAPVSTKG